MKNCDSKMLQRILINSQGVANINSHPDIRGVDSKYGRKMTDLRRKLTLNDAQPLEAL